MEVTEPTESTEHKEVTELTVEQTLHTLPLVLSVSSTTDAVCVGVTKYMYCTPKNLWVTPKVQSAG